MPEPRQGGAGSEQVATQAPARRERAVALRYDDAREQAPRVVAKGSGLAARRLVETAEGAGVPVRRDPALASALAALELDEVVPPELFEALAVVIAWAYEQESHGRSHG
jgi:flagellar biosynthesis protein